MKQFIFVNSGGDYEESVNAYEQADFKDSSAGAGDAGKPIKLDAAGHVDASMINDADIDHSSITNTHNLTTDIDHDTITNGHNLTTDIDHGGIAGLGDDDHSIYSLADGSRDYSAVVKYSSHPSFNANEQLVDKKYVDDTVTGFEWQDSVLDRLSDPPGSPGTGDRYLVVTSGTGVWTGKEDDITQYNGSSWDFYTPNTGWNVSVDDETDGIYLYTGSQWDKKFYESTTASLGVKKIGVDLQADIQASSGIKLTGNSMAIEPADFAGAGLADDGADNLKVGDANKGIQVNADDLEIDGSEMAGDGIKENVTNSYQLDVDLYTGGGLKIISSQLAVEPNDIAGNGLEDDGSDNLQLDLKATGGLKIDATEVAVEPNDFAGEGLADDGSDNLKIDWSTTFNDSKAVKASDIASTANAKGASIVGIEDSGGHTTETSVEGAIQELYANLSGFGVEYTVGTGGVTKGDLVYVGSNNTVLPYTTITAAQVAIGIAAEDVSAGNPVKILGNDTILGGILSSATAGTKYYWDGANGWSTSMPDGPGEYVWLGGVAKNATDAHIQIQFIKKNS